MKRIFALRTRALPLKCNAPSKHSDNFCLVPECLGEDRETHIYDCQFLKNENDITQNNNEYNDIFSCDVSKQVKVMHRFFDKYQKRNLFLSSHQRGPGAPQENQSFGSRKTRIAKKKHTLAQLSCVND